MDGENVVCMRVYIAVYICICVYIYVYTHTHTYVHTGEPSVLQPTGS